MEFAWLKLIHLGAVLISFTLFFLRGVWLLWDEPQPHPRWTRIVPHVNDTLLLAAGVWMAVTIRQYPLADAWLTAKLAGLVVYIALGTLALRPGRSLRARRAAWLAAQCVFAYIVAVAITRDPLPLRTIF